MAQTTVQMSAVNAKIEISVNGSSWTDISGHGNKVDVPEQTRKSGEAWTFDGDGAVITAGKLEPVEITVTVIYTEGATDAVRTVETQFNTADGGALYLRWSPGGGDAGDRQYATGACVVTGFQEPPVDAGSGDPIVITFKVKCANITPSTVAT